MSDQNGLTQSPFKDAWPTPDIGGTGLNGTGGGLDQGSGANGIVSSPWDNPVVPTPSGQRTADAFGTPPETVQVDGGSPSGSQMNWDVTQSRNTIDKR
jgi:hypothetical protein